MSARPKSETARPKSGTVRPRLKQVAFEFQRLCPRLRVGQRACWRKSGSTHMRLGSYSRAVRSFRRAIRLGADAHLHSNLAGAYAAQARNSAARRHFALARKLAPNDPRVRRRYAAFLIRARLYRAAGAELFRLRRK